jgi:hypothetical protein
MQIHRLASAALAGLALLALAPAIAAAQPSTVAPGARPAPSPYYAPRYVAPDIDERGFFIRRGLALGFGFGLGGMHNQDGPFRCADCGYDPLTAGFDFHIGGMLSTRFALLLELQVDGQTLDYNGTQTLTHSVAALAGQFWLSPQLWLKAGIGPSHIGISVDDYYGDSYERSGADGGAFLGAVGYELLSSQHFAIDAQARLLAATYDDFQGNKTEVTTGTIGVGFDWY